jgi:predicted HicB family RNase H-like nuclease
MSETLQYKGYDGSVLYSGEDKMLHGRVLGIRDMISYGGTDMQALEKNFRDAVEEYLLFCERRGKTPDVPF